MSPDKFEPKKLKREDVDVPIEGHWRVMDPADVKRLQEKALEDRRRFAAFGPRLRKRLLRLVVSCVLGYMALTWLFAAVVSLKALLVGVGVGAFLAWLPPRKDFYTTLFAASGLLCLAWARNGMPGIFQIALILISFGIFGILMSLGEESRRFEGLD